jgi:phospholipid/cholesterol/gamma-HCH transport system permease protein
VLTEVRQALVWGDLMSGISKCVIFGLIIGAISCSQGQAVRAGAVDVGRRTTASVVVSIFFIIAADTAFTWIFHGA